MHLRINTLLFFLFSFGVLTSCDLINPDEEIPSYISINKISLNNENAKGITDAWVYVDTKFIGVFELPAEFPVLAQGSSDIQISPGIKVNGISVTRTFYPFYQAYKTTAELKPGEVITINPTVGYNEYADVVWSENFEGTEMKFEHDSTLNFYMVRTNEDYFEGLYSGVVNLDSSCTYFEEISKDYLLKPDKIRLGMYLEMNFKSDMAFAVSLIASHNNTYPERVSLVDLNPTKTWKKIYIDLYNPLSGYAAGSPYKISINNLGLAQDTILDAKIFVDNLKIVQDK